MDQPKIKIGRLFECESARGNTYFRGRLNGSARMVLFKDARGAENEWELFIQAVPEEEIKGSTKPSTSPGVELQAVKPRKRRKLKGKMINPLDPIDGVADLWMP